MTDATARKEVCMDDKMDDKMDREGTVTTRSGLLKRYVWYIVALVGVIACTALALVQEPRPLAANPAKETASFRQWLSSPIEENARQRLSMIPDSIRNIAVSKDNRRLWLVGENGLILQSLDGGKTWTKLDSGTVEYLYDVHMAADNHTGWVVGGKGTILATTDGGKTWAKLSSGTVEDLKAVHMAADNRNGWVVGDKGTILVTRDSGKIWAKQDIYSEEYLTAVDIVDDNHTGWVVGLGGTILATTDGGNTWTRQDSGTVANLNAVHMAADNRTGWVVGSKGTILATTNGGKTWTKQDSGTMEDLYKVHMAADKLTGWVVGDLGTILATTNGGKTWTKQTSGTVVALSAMHTAEDNRTGWVVGDLGTILATTNGGKTWTKQAIGKVTYLDHIHMAADDRTGWVVGMEGTILATTNGGKTWTKQDSGTMEDLYEVHMAADNHTGWVVGGKGTILATTNGGNTWAKQDSHSEEVLKAVHIAADNRTGWVVGGWKVTILATTDGGKTWAKQDSHSEEFLKAVHMAADNRTGWVVGDKGTILVTTNGGNTWAKQDSGTVEVLNAVHMAADKLTGWVVGGKGTILATTDGGNTWTKQDSGTVEYLTAVHMAADNRTGWVVGMGGTILATTDGGKTWKVINTYRRYPAPWYYLCLMVCLGIVGIGYWRTRKPEIITESVKDILVSDKPLCAGETDYLGFTALAQGIARFIRNPNTLPPLTIAIVKDWGMGKSSLMNLIRQDLTERHHAPVWFNAWHHQKEEHLLAALLENIRLQAIPQLWQPGWWLFWLRLFGVRLKRHLAGFVLALGVMCFVIGIGVGIWISPDFSNVINEICKLFPEIKGLVNFFEHYKSGSSITLIMLLSLIPSLVYLWQKLKPFGQGVVEMYKKTRTSLIGAELLSDTGFRYRFGRQFQDVTWALGRRRLVIFIDDLDRCRPEHVLTILEVVNFLVSSGECFIIMGIEQKMVLGALAYHFKDVADYLVQDTTGQASTEVANDQREKEKCTRLAGNYLEKLINMEIVLPPPSAQQTRAMLCAENQGTDAHIERNWRNRAAGILEAVFKAGQSLVVQLLVIVLAITVMLGAVGIGGYWLSKYIGISLPDRTEQTNPATVGAVTQKNTTALTQQSTETRYSLLTVKSIVGIDFKPGQVQRLRFEFFLIVVPLLVIVGWLVYRKEREEVFHDSDAFKQALIFWHPLVVAHSNSPRSIKRFQNQVRFLAMRYSVVLKHALTERFLAWVRGTPLEERVKELSEDVLVTLCALHHYQSNLIEDEHRWAEVRDSLNSGNIQGKSLSGIILELNLDIANYAHLVQAELFNTITDKHREKFLEIIGESQ